MAEQEQTLSEKEQLVQRLIEILVRFIPRLQSQVTDFSKDYFAQRVLLRGLMNMHSVQNQLPQEFFLMQDKLLQLELKEKTIVDAQVLKPCKLNSNISLHRGDITCLKADAIVNYANSNLLGCFKAGHNCVDNCIHSAAGLQLRFECFELLGRKNIDVPAGMAVITRAYNLPCKFVIHAVGPKIAFEPTKDDEQKLKDCYLNSLKLARSNGIKTLAFSCISSGIYAIPHMKAATIAVNTVNDDLKAHGNDLMVLFDVMTDGDFNAYDHNLNPKEQSTGELHPFFNLNLF